MILYVVIMIYRVGVGVHIYIQPEPVGDVGARRTPPPTVIKGWCYSRGEVAGCCCSLLDGKHNARPTRHLAGEPQPCCHSWLVYLDRS